MQRTVTHTAPGKLFIAGEYAVLEPGQPSIVVAMDRFITVRASTPRAGEVVLATDLLPHEVRLFRSRTGLRAADPADIAYLGGALAHLASAVETVDQLRSDLALPPVPVQLSVHSGLHERGIKIGLGSSGAVTVATIAALTDFYAMTVGPELRFRLAMLASVRTDAGPSGADLAASTWGGWLAYHAPDRALLLRSLKRDGPARTLQATWPGLMVRALPPPNTLVLHTGWSGTPASTTARIRRLARTDWRNGPSFHQFLASSQAIVTAAIRALEQDTPGTLLTAVHDAHHLLASLDQDTRLGIFTPSLNALCAAAEACGGAAKPSGAGGGDCGIALLPDTVPTHVLHGRWSAAGITPLPLRVTPAPHSTGQAAPLAGPDPKAGPAPEPDTCPGPSLRLPSNFDEGPAR